MKNPCHLVVLTGAGVSKESGLDTFRDKDGVWSKHSLEDVATPRGFAKNPALVYQFYNDRRRALPAAKPNAAHLALAALEKNWPGRFLLVTQNVDDLHERAGSKRVHHLHGSLSRGRCTRCQHVFDCTFDLGIEVPCPNCRHTNCLRPDVVWFEEQSRQVGKVLKALRECGLFLAIGTSGQVYPAADFVNYATENGARTVELNLEETGSADLFDDSDYGPATVVVPQYVETLLKVVA